MTGWAAPEHAGTPKPLNPKPRHRDTPSPPNLGLFGEVTPACAQQRLFGGGPEATETPRRSEPCTLKPSRACG